jgi:group I intron endonuclease
MYGIIYLAENKANGKSYVGQTIRNLNIRRNEHIGRPCDYSVIDRAIKKYGKNNFKWTIIDEANDQELLNQLERLHISRYESMVNEWGYNIIEGGSNGKQSQETIQKRMETRKGFKHSTESRLKMSTTRQNQRGKTDSRIKSIAKITSKYPGASYHKQKSPEKRCWTSAIQFNKTHKHLGLFEDPITASLVYQLVWAELYN